MCWYVTVHSIAFVLRHSVPFFSDLASRPQNHEFKTPKPTPVVLDPSMYRHMTQQHTQPMPPQQWTDDGFTDF